MLLTVNMVSLRQIRFSQLFAHIDIHTKKLDGMHMIIGVIRVLRNAVGVSDFTGGKALRRCTGQRY